MLKRSLIFVHRWLGVALCLLFILWFPSGIGMMYFSYPDISPADRLERAPALPASRVALSPSEAAAQLGGDANELRLDTLDGRPAYRVAGGRGGGSTVLYTDTGQAQKETTKA